MRVLFPTPEGPDMTKGLISSGSMVVGGRETNERDGSIDRHERNAQNKSFSRNAHRWVSGNYVI